MNILKRLPIPVEITR